MHDSRAGDRIQKQYQATVTKVDDAPHGGFDALVAVFGNVDSQGDVVRAGAFTRSLSDWGDRPIPVLWAHQFYDMGAFIGKASAEETAEGLVFHAEFLDTDSGQLARKLLAEGLVSEFSFSGRIREGAWVEKEDEDYYEILDVDLWEAGPCFKGANHETQLLGIKALGEQVEAERKALTKTDVETLRGVHKALGEVIDDALTPPAGDPPDPQTPDQDASGAPPTTSKAPADAGAFVVPAALKARLALSTQEGRS